MPAEGMRQVLQGAYDVSRRRKHFYCTPEKCLHPRYLNGVQAFFMLFSCFRMRRRACEKPSVAGHVKGKPLQFVFISQQPVGLFGQRYDMGIHRFVGIYRAQTHAGCKLCRPADGLFLLIG